MKSSDPEASLRKGSLPSGNGGLKAPGNYQAKDERADAMSDTETLGKAPAPESVKDAKLDHECVKLALSKYFEDSGNTK
jgi:hypothetical protein